MPLIPSTASKTSSGAIRSRRFIAVISSSRVRIAPRPRVGGEPTRGPIEIAPARHLSVDPTPCRTGRVRHLVEVAPETIKHCSVGDQRRPQLLDIPPSLLASGDLVSDEAGEGGAKQRRPRRDAKELIKIYR